MVWPVQVEEEHVLHVKTKRELDQTKSQLEGEVGRVPGGWNLDFSGCMYTLGREWPACS